MITENDMDLIENRLRDNFATKDDLQQLRSDLIDKLDAILKEVIASREEREVVSARLSDHEDRITSLESSK